MILPLFPLQLVVYPGERLALHIFEQRYRDLVLDCQEQGITFGVPTYLDNQLAYGTEVVLKEVVKQYATGESDIICTGRRIFKINEFIKKLPDHLYAGGEVTFIENKIVSDIRLQNELLVAINDLYTVLQVEDAPNFSLPFTSYQVAHKVGLALEQEYHLLKIPTETERLQYIIGHLAITIPVVKQMNRTKEVIKLNGHFKNFDPLDFEDFKT